MGGIYLDTKLKDQPAKDVTAKWRQIHDQAQYNDGHGGYSGSFAEKPTIAFPPQEFATDADAEEWVCDNNDKWGPVDAVKVREPALHWYIGGWCSS